MPNFEKIVLAVDGSPGSIRATEVACDLVKLSKGSVRVVHVIEEVHHAQRAGDFALEESEDVARFTKPHVDVLTEAGVDHTLDVRRARVGHVAKEIVAIAHEISADAIVMGTRGDSMIGGLLLGSTAFKVLHVSDLPVVVVPFSDKA